MATLGSVTNMSFLSVVNGKFAQRVGEGTDGAEKRTNKNNKIIFERYYQTAEGVITKLEIKTKEFEGRTFKTMCITLDNEIQLQFVGGIDNAQNKAIVNALLTAKITDPIRFVATKDDEGYSKVYPMQYDKGLKWFSTKDHPQGVPQPVKKTVAGEEKWDWDKQSEWYFGKFQELAEKVKKENNKFSQPEEKEEVETETTVDDFPDKPKDELKGGVVKSEKSKKKEINEDVNPDDIPF